MDTVTTVGESCKVISVDTSDVVFIDSAAAMKARGSVKYRARGDTGREVATRYLILSKPVKLEYLKLFRRPREGISCNKTKSFSV